jgi:hypothetical protein
MKKRIKIKYLTTAIQWIFSISVIFLSYFLSTMIFEHILIHYVVVFSVVLLYFLQKLIFEINIFLFKTPYPVLTDYGYKWLRINKGERKDKFYFGLYKNYYIFWVRENYEVEQKYIYGEKYEVDRIKLIIEYTLRRIEEKKLKDEKNIYTSFKKWNKIATDKKELLREEIIDDI